MDETPESKEINDALREKCAAADAFEAEPTSANLKAFLAARARLQEIVGATDATPLTPSPRTA